MPSGGILNTSADGQTRSMTGNETRTVEGIQTTITGKSLIMTADARLTVTDGGTWITTGVVTGKSIGDGITITGETQTGTGVHGDSTGNPLQPLMQDRQQSRRKRRTLSPGGREAPTSHLPGFE